MIQDVHCCVDKMGSSSNYDVMCVTSGYCHNHVAVVRGWWSTILIMLLWSRVGGQLFSSRCCGQGLVANYSHHVAVVRGWWSAIVSSCCCGQGLVVSYSLIMLVVNSAHVL